MSGSKLNVGNAHILVMPHVNKQGESITVEEWRELRLDAGYCVLKQESFPNGLMVSTIWLGLNIHDNFQSMVMTANGQDVESLHTSTEELALEAHELLAEPIRSRDAALRQYGADSGIVTLQDGAL